MAAIGHFIMNTATAALSAFNHTNETKPLHNFEGPSPHDVLAVKDILHETSKLPLEIIDTIIDLAEYWPHTIVTTKGEAITVGNHKTDTFILRSFPLGYDPETPDNGRFTLPVDKYFKTPSLPRGMGLSDAIKDTTLSILTKWEAQSLPRGEHPCRKVVFTIKSCDQGWGGEPNHRGTYEGSYTWFDVGLEQLKTVDVPEESNFPEGYAEQFRLGPDEDRMEGSASISCDLRTVLPPAKWDPSEPSGYKFDHPFLPSGARLQSNMTATREIKEYVITWACDDCIDPESPEGNALEEKGRGKASANGCFVRNLKVGDIITVWARARFPGWANVVKEIKIDVYWAV